MKLKNIKNCCFYCKKEYTTSLCFETFIEKSKKQVISCLEDYVCEKCKNKQIKNCEMYN